MSGAFRARGGAGSWGVGAGLEPGTGSASLKKRPRLLRFVAVALDLIRLFVGVTILAFASFTDWEWRRAPNALWLGMALVGAVLLAAEWALDPAGFVGRWPYLAFIPAFAALMYGLWWLGLIAGGADAKALMALAVLVPFPADLVEGVPAFASPVPASFSVLGNSLLLFLVIPAALFIWNVAHGALRLPHAFLGVKRRGADVERGHAWPMETIDAEGRRRSRFFASRMDQSEVDEQFERIRALGDEKVWVTPKIPFMIPLLGGFVLAFVVGDVLTTVFRAVLPAP